MARVKHPLHDDIIREVDGRSVSRWVKAGWVDISPPADKEEKQQASVAPTRSRKTTRKKG